jgi:anti-sigma regulatory factor (Ser/Thr protein kinase)
VRRCTRTTIDVRAGTAGRVEIATDAAEPRRRTLLEDVVHDLSQIGPLRAALDHALIGLGCTRALHDAAIVLTELLANGLQHGRPPVALRVEVDSQRRVTVEVRDTGLRGKASSVVTASLPDDPLSEAGRGLWIVTALADKFELLAVDEGHVATAVLVC